MKNPLSQPFFLGDLELPNNILYAPLAGCSDFPFRKMSVKYRPGLVYCEMVKMDALVRNEPNTFHLLDYSADMHPIGAQICGSKVPLVKKSAKIIESLGFDVIDLNCGCPVDKVTKDGSGSALLRNPEKIGEIIAEMVAAVKIPVTVKIRAGWDEKEINAAEITQIAEKAGAKAITIHGRTRKQAYKGLGDRSVIRACKEAANSILVIGNGDIFDPPSAEDMFAQTGCDAILVSRGTLGRPWIAEEIIAHFLGETFSPLSLQEQKTVFLEHFHCTLKYHADRQVPIEMRRVGCWYLKQTSGMRTFRHAMSRASSIDEVRALLADVETTESSPS